ncbi:OmpA family protein [Sulfurimonas sp.]
MKKYILQLLLVSSLFAGTYDDDYTALVKIDDNVTVKELDKFFYGNFSEIKRFDMLNFSDGELSDDSQDYLDEILKSVDTYLKSENEIWIKIIGHSDVPTDDKNELAVDSDTYANAIQNAFRYKLSSKEALENSTDFASVIAKSFKDNNIPEDITTVEYRAGLDKGFSDGTDNGRFLSNRVMVTVYVLDPMDKDTDKDTVVDPIDECPGTPLGVTVDEKGCPLDTDKDGVYDYMDECPGTPLGVTVDEKGCPLDTDKDGVYDYKDKCPGTPLGLQVDIDGCPSTITLRLNFKTDSAEIEQDSMYKVTNFAQFMKENPKYNARIVGHTDSVGDAGYNVGLSQRRAQSVKESLIEHGISANRLQSSGEGEMNPIESNDTSYGRRQNRRIEVKLFL